MSCFDFRRNDQIASVKFFAGKARFVQLRVSMRFPVFFFYFGIFPFTQRRLRKGGEARIRLDKRCRLLSKDVDIRLDSVYLNVWRIYIY